MSELSRRTLGDVPNAMHEQFDLLVTAMLLQAQLENPLLAADFDSQPDKLKYDWLRSRLNGCVATIDGEISDEFNDDERLGIFFLYFEFYESYTTVLKFKVETPLTEIQRSILGLAAPALNRQLELGETANIVDMLCSFVPILKHHEAFLGEYSGGSAFEFSAHRAKGIAYAKSRVRVIENKNKQRG